MWENLNNGACISLYNLMKEMQEKCNVNVSVLTKGEGTLTQKCREKGIQVFILKHYPCITEKGIIKKLKGYVKLFINHIIHYRRFLRFILDNNIHFDLIHTNTHASDIGYFISEHFHIHHVVHLREHGMKDNGLDYTLPDSVMREKFKNTDAEIAISHSVYNHYVNERKLCPQDRTRIIYNGIRIYDKYEKVYLSGGRVNFCIAGRIFEGKNQLMAVNACIKLKALKDKFIVHIIGYDTGRYSHELKTLIHSEDIEECVMFMGFREDIDDVLMNMDVGLMLSRCEAFRRVTVEYMMHYMPVIGVNTGATPEIVLDGETGYICGLNDTDRLAELMHKFIMNPGLIREMGTKGRERAVKNFSLERNTDEIYKLYQEILSR